MRNRGSITGPLILITIGVLFLMHTVWPEFSVGDLIANYWPFLLIIWGVLQLIEVSVRAGRTGTPMANGINAGGWFLVILICIAGFTMFEVRGHDTWWRRVSFDQGMDWFGEAHNYTVAPQTKTVTKNVRIVIESFRGNARITGADTDQVALTGHKTVRALKDAEADQADQATPVEVVSDDGTITIRCNQSKASGKARVSTDLELTVPKGASVEATGRLGDFDISNLDGNVDIVSDNAGVRLQDIGGDVKVDTRRGDIVRCTNVKGGVELKGHGSDVELEKIAGQVTIDGAYPGTITLRDLARPLRVNNFGSSLTVQKVTGQITMDRGSFSAQDIVGPTQLNTRATDVDITGFSEALDLSVDKGDINLRPVKLPLGRMTVTTHSGNIDLALPAAAKFDLKAVTEHGDIDNEFGDALKLENSGGQPRLSGSVGAGPSINLNSGRGSITVRKANAGDMERANDAGAVDGGVKVPPLTPIPPKNPPAPRAPTVEL